MTCIVMLAVFLFCVCANPSDVLIVRKIELNCKLKYLCENSVKICQVVFNARAPIAVLVSLSCNITSSKTMREAPRHSHTHSPTQHLGESEVGAERQFSVTAHPSSGEVAETSCPGDSLVLPHRSSECHSSYFLQVTHILHWKNPVDDCRYDPTGKMKLIKMKELSQMHVRELENKY